MTIDPRNPGPEALAFLAEYHLGVLGTHRSDHSIHLVPVGFTYDPETQLVRIITRSGSRKVRNIAARPGHRVSVSSVDGGRWLTFEGPAEVSSAPDRVAEAVERYAARYRQPGESDDRVVIEISVDRILGRA
ncbi:MAG: TIGR03618 family F420-dependent PPOX class oxidoreductase [Microthrixaceae bacterium]|nr:TIGR03618 family F420-dependent PPOX class oxidoreductase [Microthrixaceae bacterium]MCO5311732.1 TIGR03618 family F420-dependent PPOX class oxidoreductase [Microthrixaceae bacterium]HPB44943.1 TIGR03618 family F420-dependent PPOX class oxidoreductase [Microthrixaceae bacterium]